MADKHPTDPLLTLSTLVVRQRIDIDGKRYPVRNIGELSPLEMDRFSDRFKRIDALNDKHLEATDADIDEVHQILGEVVADVVIGLEPEVLAKLLTLQRLAIGNLFIGRSGIGSPPASVSTPAPASPKPGDKPRRASAGRTAASARRAGAGSTRRSK